MRSFFFMWIGLVAMKVWMRVRAAGGHGLAGAADVVLVGARQRADGRLPAPLPATACTASKSPSLAAGKPASITSTRMRSSCLPMRTLSSRVIEAPGLCSPSRMVVSNMIKWSCMWASPGKWDETLPARLPGGTATAELGGWGF